MVIFGGISNEWGTAEILAATTVVPLPMSNSNLYTVVACSAGNYSYFKGANISTANNFTIYTTTSAGYVNWTIC